MTKDRVWTYAEKGAPNGIGGVRTLTTGDLGVVFQPIVDVLTGATFAHEALVRCKRPEYAPPPVLFEHAVEENACGRLGRLIREVAFATCGDVPLFVNLHPEELSSRWLVRPDDPIGFHSRPVFLEITESAAFTHFKLCIDVLKELCRRTGAALVIDDFGAGHSNLERMANLEPSIVKLDLAVTRDVHHHPRKQVIVRHIVNLCRELGASVVAEGVEVVDELKCVRDLGVSYAQGYLLARPAAPPPTVAWPFGDGDRQKSIARQGKRPPPLPNAVHRPSEPTRSKRAPRTEVAAPTRPARAMPPRPTHGPGPRSKAAGARKSQKPTARPVRDR
jgi:EAL domain-containing protein (putative c-di-GMP-specific phosphodiesterase class I)